jgi:acetyl esterase/lipase
MMIRRLHPVRSMLAAATVLYHAACGGTLSQPGSHTREWRDVPYASASAAQRLDLYLPPAGAGPFPVVIWVHGGGWQSGSRALGAGAVQRRVAERGVALASVGYRLSGEAQFPAQIHDVKAAVRWLRANAARHRLDGTRIGAWGASAGGHLVALLGTSYGVDAMEDATLGNASASSSVSAVVDWFGPTDFLRMDEQTAAIDCPTFAGVGHDGAGSPESRLMGFAIQSRPDSVRRADPVTYVRADVPAFLIQHGTRDCTVPWPQSQLLFDRITQVAGAGRALFERLDDGHGGPVFDSAANVSRVLDFLEQQLGR